jgi:EAL domain-containing protein (putative c-di-GMP-specific phosphodiesterase class I)
VIAEGIDNAEDAAMVARRMLDALNTPFFVGDEEIVVSASIGISMYPTDDVDLDGLVRHTDMAMYRSKSLGRGTYSFFSDDLNAAVSARLSLEGSLRHAMDRKEFQLHFQPKADLRTGAITGVEALLRWHRPGLGLVPPDRFIAVLEDTGMILPVGAWVIRTACAQLAEWDRQGLPRLRMAVNLSARQFRHLYLASMVEDSLRENYIDPSRLEIELTESLLMEDTETTRGMLESFSRIGVRLAIDDFGTGHSSLSYIKRFNIDTLKIDRSFVQSLPDDSEDVAIATAVIALGRSMQMTVVAEGVETQAQAEVLRRLGCHEMQLAAVTLPAEPALILAGAGSGKTRVLTTRIAWLLSDRPGVARRRAGGDLHQQGRQGDADAPGGDAADRRARHVDRHLPRPVQPLPARALEARRPAAGLPDPRQRRPALGRQARHQGDEPRRGALRAQAGDLVHRRLQGRRPAPARRGARDAQSRKLVEVYQAYESSASAKAWSTSPS